MTFDPIATLDVLSGHALAAGWFGSVTTHEPKAAPDVESSLALAIWLQQISPVPAASGMAATSMRVEWNARIYTSMLMEPQDAIDPGMMLATIDLVSRWSSDYDLGGNIRNLDLLGACGPPLAARTGYLTQDGRIMRVATIVVPCIVSDLFAQGA